MSHATVRNAPDGALLECPVCGASELIEAPIPVSDFVARMDRFSEEHRHPDDNFALEA